MLCEKRKEQVLELTRQLIRQQSYSGHEDKAAAVLTEGFKSLGFDDVYVDGYGNTVGILRGARPGKKVLFDGHMDTVPVTDEAAWTHKPFDAEVEAGMLYGRGATDMKGALAATACGAAFFAEDCGRDFAGEIYVAGSVHEECFEGVASRSLSAHFQPDYVIIAEASQLNLKIGQRGRAEIVFETVGKPAHSANPEKGINAVYKMAKLIDAVQKLVPTHHPVLGKGIMELVDIKSEPYPGASVVPQYCRATYDRRLLVGETKESVLAPLQAAIDALAAADPDFKCRVSFAVGRETCYTGEEIVGERFFPGWLFDREEPFVQDVYAELKAAGFDPEITQYNFCTNGSHYAGEAGIKTFGLGPSRENLAHTIDEHVELEQLYSAAECYMAALRALLKE